MEKTTMMTILTIPNVMSYHYLVVMLLLTISKTSVTQASTVDPRCTLSSQQIPFQQFGLSEGLNSGEIQFNFSLTDAGSFDANIYVCTGEQGSTSKPCIWKKMDKIKQTVEASNLISVVKFSEDLNCFHCLLKWVITRKDSNPPEYVGCSKVANLEAAQQLSEGSGFFTVSTKSTTVISTTLSTTNCKAVGIYKRVPGMNQWCVVHCTAGYCPHTHCICDSDDTLKCTVADTYKNTPGMLEWCFTNCRAGHCPETHCKCNNSKVTQTCTATGVYINVPGMNQWCKTNCRAGNCPATHCKCSTTAK